MRGTIVSVVNTLIGLLMTAAFVGMFYRLVSLYVLRKKISSTPSADILWRVVVPAFVGYFLLGMLYAWMEANSTPELVARIALWGCMAVTLVVFFVASREVVKAAGTPLKHAKPTSP